MKWFFVNHNGEQKWSLAKSGIRVLLTFIVLKLSAITSCQGYRTKTWNDSAVRPTAIPMIGKYCTEVPRLASSVVESNLLNSCLCKTLWFNRPIENISWSSWSWSPPSVNSRYSFWQVALFDLDEAAKDFAAMNVMRSTQLIKMGSWSQLDAWDWDCHRWSSTSTYFQIFPYKFLLFFGTFRGIRSNARTAYILRTY